MFRGLGVAVAGSSQVLQQNGCMEEAFWSLKCSKVRLEMTLTEGRDPCVAQTTLVSKHSYGKQAKGKPKARR